MVILDYPNNYIAVEKMLDEDDDVGMEKEPSLGEATTLLTEAIKLNTTQIYDWKASQK